MRSTRIREMNVPVDGARLHVRDAGEGAPIIVLHGGPDFDYDYLLPDLDRLAESFRLICYDQRGRGRSAAGVRAEDITMRSEVADLEAVRAHYGFGSVTLLGHSWGGLIAMEYAIRHPERVSRLILANTAPASNDDYLAMRRAITERRPADDAARMKALAAGDAYARGDLATLAEIYRLYFRIGVRRPEDLDRLMANLLPHATPEGVLLARAIQSSLYEDTWLREGYDLFPALGRLAVPTLVVHGDHDLIPAECARRIAAAIPGARFVLLEDTGHFAYLESPEAFGREVRALMAG
jgi:proline iminopeptidase